MNKTSIEWARNPDGTQGYTWNPITGCLNHVNGLCKGGGFPCYAYKLANTRLKQRYLANKNTATNNYDEDSYPFYPRFWKEKLLQIRGDGNYDNCYPDRNAYFASITKEKGIFVCDMGDLFGIGLPEAWTRQVLAECKIHFNHRFYILTKQSQRLPEFSPFPDNAWIGMTLTQNRFGNKARQFLLGVQAKVKFLSLEPLLTHMDGWTIGNAITHAGWIIIGACTGTREEMCNLTNIYGELTPIPIGKRLWTAQPKIEWVREIVNAADNAGIPVFLKNNLNPLFEGRPTQEIVDMGFAMKHKSNPIAWQLRQELPE